MTYRENIRPYLSTLAVAALGVLVYMLPPKVTTTLVNLPTVVEPAPVDVKPSTPNDVAPGRAFVLRGGKPLSDKEAAPYIEVFKLGDISDLVYHGYAPDGLIVRKMTISGGPAPTVPTVPDKPVDPPPAPSTVTAVTYYYEKDKTAVPSFVHATLNKINRELSIRATVFEDDTTNGIDQIPLPHRAALEKARAEGLPMVIARSADNRVVKFAKAPKDEAAIMEVVK